MSEKKWTSEDMSAAVERALQTMEGVALELYRRGREEAREELEAVRRERDEARASCTDCAMWAERSARWHDDMQRAERERDEARAERDSAKLTAMAASMAHDSIEKMIRFELRVGPEDSLHEAVQRARYERDEARASLAQIRRVFGNAIAFDDARGDIVKMAEIAYRGACDGDKAIGQLRDMTRQRDEARAERDNLLDTRSEGAWMARALDAERMAAEAEKLSDAAKAAWDAECIMREQRDRFHAEWKQERQEVERLRVELIRAGSRECDIAACNCGTWHHQNPRAAFRRGAEAMREACADEVRSYTAWSEPPLLEFLERQVRALPIPEEP